MPDFAVKRYRPAYFTVEDEPGDETTAETLNELLNIPWVKAWTEIPGFYRFSVSDDYRGLGGFELLMAEMFDGNQWWVVAMLGDPQRYELPVFTPKRGDASGP